MKYLYGYSILLLSSSLISGAPRCNSWQKPFAVSGTNCKKYYICIRGQLCQRTCPDNQLFDKKYLMCDWKELVQECEIPVLSKCPRPEGQFIKPGTYCKKYLDCKNGIAIEKSCPSNEIFNKRKGKCDFIEYTKCEDKDFLCPKRDGTFLVKGTECKSYATCNNGKASIKKCPEKRIFDETQNTCDWEELVTCKDVAETTTIERSTTTELKTTPTEFTEITTTTFLDKIKTTTVSEITTQKEASTTKYSVTSAITENESTASPVSTTYYSPTPDEITDETTTETPKHITNSLLTNTEAATTENIHIRSTTLIYQTSSPRGCVFGDESCKPDPVLCPEERGEFPHPDISTIFIHCDHWRPYIKKCPDGLHFDARKKICDWPKT